MHSPLFSFHPADFYLPFESLPVRQPDVEQNHPITRHRKPQLSAVLPQSQFFRIREYGRHARMRHVCFNYDMGARQRSRSRILEMESYHRGSHSGGLGREFVGDHDAWRRVRPAMAAEGEDGRTKREHQAEPAAFRGWAICPPANVQPERHVAPSVESGSGNMSHLFMVVPGTGAGDHDRFSLRRKHVVVHAQNHGHENDRVVEKMELNPWNP
jgi:hypothetical protein